jgi:hypothetical protein
MGVAPHFDWSFGRIGMGDAPSGWLEGHPPYDRPGFAAGSAQFV